MFTENTRKKRQMMTLKN